MNYSPEFLLPDENYAQLMHEKVLPELAEHRVERTIPGVGNAPLRARFFHTEDSTQVICISHGFTEFCERYDEVIHLFMQCGYSAAICDHRGHGYSHRMVDEPSKIHVDSYMTYVRDYHCFVEEVKREFPGQSLKLFGHSMGGCIAGLYIETFPDDFACCVLSSPLMEVQSGGIPRFLCRGFGKAATILGQGKKYLGSQSGKDYDGSETFEDSSCDCPARFDYFYRLRDRDPHFHTRSGTIQWMESGLAAAPRVVRNAKKIRIPVLLIQAGNDTWVLPGGQNRFVNACDTAEILRCPGARHEVFNGPISQRQRYWGVVMPFLNEH